MDSLAIPGFEAHGFETPIEQDFTANAWPRQAPPRLASTPAACRLQGAAPVSDAPPIRCVNSARACGR
jgi:hypothetical protein